MSLSTLAADRAYAATKDLILSGAVAPGALITEGAIADQLELSRTPVREAFLRLEGEQLLQLIPKRGALVVPISPTDAVDVLDVRIALETGAVRRLAASSEDRSAVVAVLAGLLGQQSEYATSADAERFAEVDELFHRSIVSAAGNGIADRFYGTLADRQRRMTMGAVSLRPQRMKAITAEHRQLLDAVRAGDVAGYDATLTQHLVNTHEPFRTLS